MACSLIPFEDRKAALDRVRQIIPAGASVNTGASVTLREIGLEDFLISKNHPWRNLKDEVLAEKRKDMTGGKMGSKISKTLIIQHEVEFLARKVTLLLVREAVGD